MLTAIGSVIALIGLTSCGSVKGTGDTSIRVERPEPVDFGVPAAAPPPQEVAVANGVTNFAGPATLPAIEIVRKPVTNGVVEATANLLGMADVRQTVTKDGRAATADNEWELSFVVPEMADCFSFESRSFLSGGCDANVENGRIPQLPEAGEIAKLATDYLKSIGLGQGLVLARTHVKTSAHVEDPKTGSVRIIPTSVAAVFRPQIDGMTVEGPGAKVVVVFGEQGTLLSFFHWVPETRPSNAVNIRPVADALDDIRAGKGLPPAQGELASVEVQDVDMRYFAEPLASGPSFWKPVYAFQVREKGTSGPLEIWFVDAQAE